MRVAPAGPAVRPAPAVRRQPARHTRGAHAKFLLASLGAAPVRLRASAKRAPSRRRSKPLAASGMPAARRAAAPFVPPDQDPGHKDQAGRLQRAFRFAAIAAHGEQGRDAGRGRGTAVPGAHANGCRLGHHLAWQDAERPAARGGGGEHIRPQDWRIWDAAQRRSRRRGSGAGGAAGGSCCRYCCRLRLTGGGLGCFVMSQPGSSRSRW